MDSESISRILIVAIIANLAVMVLLVVPALRRRRRDHGHAIAASAGSNGGVIASAVLAERLAAVAGPRSAMGAVPTTGADAGGPEFGSPDVAPIGAPGSTIDHISGADQTDMHANDAETQDTADDETQVARPRRFTMPADDDRATDAIEAFLSGSRRPDRDNLDRRRSADEQEGRADDLVDPVTGLDSQFSWSRAVASEQARSARYGRPATVVIAELDGLDVLAGRFGEVAADRLIPPVADAIRRNARSADRVARLGPARFGVLLAETDEVRAINYVERVRAACDRWLEASAVAVRLSVGWASSDIDGDLGTAVRKAEDRMHREQRRAAPWRPAITGPDPTEA
jgi:diguanylate cyclase (GGDEF)-like protein